MAGKEVSYEILQEMVFGEKILSGNPLSFHALSAAGRLWIAGLSERPAGYRNRLYRG